MVAGLRGTILERTERSVLLEVHGVVYELFMTSATIQQCPIGTETLLYTLLHQRDEGPTLYGFSSLRERGFFQLLLTVNGVGPKWAMAILGLGNIDELEKTIAAGDAKLLTTVSGIGKKTAERLVIELRDKIGERGLPVGDAAGGVVDALVRLGYTAREARGVVATLDHTRSVEDQVRDALKHLGKRT